jgi:uncharacterized membrane-anchored protein
MTAIIISILASIVSGMVLFFLQRFFKRQEKKDNERSKTRIKENVLILKSIDAIGKLTYANTIAIRDGKVNGELADSLQAYNVVKEEMYDYLLEQNARR